MSLCQKILVGLVVLALGAAVAIGLRRNRVPRLPEVSWALLEGPLAKEIQAREAALQPSSAAQWSDLAETYFSFGLFPQSEYCFEQVDKLQPADGGYIYGWGLSLGRMGETTAARKKYQRLLGLLAADPSPNKSLADLCWYRIGEDYLREQNAQEAEKALRQAAAIPKARYLLTRVLTRTGRAAEAVAILEELDRQLPPTIDVNLMRSWAEEALGHHQAAIQFDERSLRTGKLLKFTDPFYRSVEQRRARMGSMAWYNQSLELEGQGKLAEAFDLCARSLQAFWTEDKAFELAKLQLEQKHFKEAVAQAEESIARVGASARALDLIGVASINLDDYARAQQVWEQATLIEDTPDLRRKLAELARKRGDQASVQWHFGLEKFNEGKKAFLTNDLQAALPLFQAAVANSPQHLLSWFYLAETLRFLGDKTGAERAYRESLSLDPFFGRSLAGLDRLTNR
jgi:tetratricopeptide (TPR) repeat protein